MPPILAILLTLIASGILAIDFVDDISAQGVNNSSVIGHNTSTTQESPSIPVKRENITGSINLMSTISKAIESQVNFSLGDATAAAEKKVGNGSHAIKAQIGDENGYLAYKVWVVDQKDNFHNVIIDPGDGKILISRELTALESKINHGLTMPYAMDSRYSMMPDNSLIGRNMLGDQDYVK